MLDFFLNKLKKAAEKTYLELIKKQSNQNLLMKGINNFSSVTDSLKNVKFDINVSLNLTKIINF